MSVTAWGKPSWALVGNLASKARSLEPPKEFTLMPEGSLGLGSRELGKQKWALGIPGAAEHLSQWSMPWTAGCRESKALTYSFARNCDLVQGSSLFWASASSSAKPEHLLVTPGFPSRFQKSDLELMRVVSLVHPAPGSTGWFPPALGALSWVQVPNCPCPDAASDKNSGNPTRLCFHTFVVRCSSLPV